MAWNIHWQCCFSSVEGEQYAVNIYEEDYAGSVVQLTGAENPFTTSEDDDTDIFTPIRTQSGYLRVIDMAGDLMGQLVPDSSIQRMVRMYKGTYSGTWPDGAFTPNELKWQGFIQADVFTQNLDGYDIVEIPLEDMLSSLQCVTLPNDFLNKKYNFAKFIVSGFDAISADVLQNLHIVAPIYDTLNDFLLNELQAKIFFSLEDTNLGLEVIGETFYDALEAILKLFGLTARMEGSTLVFAQYDYSGSLRVAEYTIELLRNAADRSLQTPPVPTITDIVVSPLLDTVTPRGDSNQVSYMQGAKLVETSISLTGESFTFVRVPEMNETSQQYKKVSLYPIGRFYVQGGDVTYDPTYSQWSYSRRKNEVCREYFLFYKFNYVADGILNWMFTNGTQVAYSDYFKPNTIITNNMNTIAPYTNHDVYVGAQPARFFYQEGAEYVSMYNGIMFQLKKVNTNSDPNYTVNDLYHVISDYSFRFTRGVIAIDTRCISLKNGFGTPDILVMKETVVNTKILCSLRVHNKYWNGSAWVGSPTAKFTISFKPDGSIVDNRSSFGVDYNANIDGYWAPIPTDIVLEGDVEFTIYDSVIEQSAGPNWVSAYVWDLSISYQRCDIVTARHRDKNIYILKNQAKKFNDDKVIRQRIGTFNNNITSPLMITRFALEQSEEEVYIQKIQYYIDQQNRVLNRPEQHLVERMSAHYGITRSAIKMYVKNNLATLRNIFTFGGKKFFAINSNIEWRDETDNITLIEIY